MEKKWSERRDFYHVSRGEPSTFTPSNGPGLGRARGVSRPDAPNAGDHHPTLETSHGIGPVCNPLRFCFLWDVSEFETHRKPEDALNTAAHLDGILIAMRNLFHHIEASLEAVPIDE